MVLKVFAMRLLFISSLDGGARLDDAHQNGAEGEIRIIQSPLNRLANFGERSPINRDGCVYGLYWSDFPQVPVAPDLNTYHEIQKLSEDAR